MLFMTFRTQMIFFFLYILLAMENSIVLFLNMVVGKDTEVFFFTE